MLLTLVACLFSPVVLAQNFQNLPQNQNNVRQGRVIIVPLPKDASGGDVYPDCNKGKVCLPVASECAVRQSRVGATRFEGKTYWFSWQSNEEVLRNAKWNWFTARNYCRKRCMDLVSYSVDC